jgi:hypothetical protein
MSITRPFRGYMIQATDERDFSVKRNKIANGDTHGFWKEQEYIARYGNIAENEIWKDLEAIWHGGKSRPEGCSCGDGKRMGRNLSCPIHGNGKDYSNELSRVKTNQNH